MIKLDFNRNWKRRIDDMTYEMFADPSSAVSVDLPDDFAIHLHRTPDVPIGSNSGFIPGGQGIYTKEFDVPASYAGKTVILDLDGAYMNAEVLINREQIAHHPYGFTPFQMNISDVLMPGMKNQIQIITQCRLPGARWYSGGGLYRQVSLYVGEPCHVEPWDLQVITESVENGSAAVSVKAAITNEHSEEKEVLCKVTLTDPDGTAAAEQTRQLILKPGRTETAFLLSLSSPQLWDDLTPNLYELRLDVQAEGQEPDTTIKRIGIRKITIDGKTGMLVNGRPVRLRGGCVHHDNTLLGACAFPRAEERKVQKLKEAGFNAVRTAHNPPSDAFLDACDRLGMYVLDESFDCWCQGKFAQDYHLYFADWWERDTTYMVLRDRNHPSVFCWSIGNEITESDGTSHADRWTKLQVDLIHRLDPSRPVTLGGMFFPNQPGEEGKKWDDPDTGDKPMGPPSIKPFRKSDALLTRQMESAKRMLETVDILSLNYSMERYAFFREHYPHKALLGTETKSYYAWENDRAVRDNANVIGDFVWTAYDYLGEAGAGRGVLDPGELKVWLCGDYPWLCSDQGDLDMDGKRRPRSYYRGVLWGLDQGVHLFARHPSKTGKHLYGMGWHWSDAAKNWTVGPEYIGAMTEVEAYADCDSVAFYVNDQLYAAVPTEKFIARCTLPYQPGELRCEAIRNGKVQAVDRIETTGTPSGIRLTADRRVIRADGQDLSFVTVEVVDDQGRTVSDSQVELQAEVTGSGTLCGFGSANPCTPEDYGTGRRRAYQGYALLCVRAGTDAGEVRAAVTAEGLTGDTLFISVEK